MDTLYKSKNLHPQPCTPLNAKLKYRFILVAAVITTAIIFSALFIPLSAGAVSPTTTPTSHISNSSDNFNTPTLLWKYSTNSGVGTYYVTRGIVHTSPIIDKGVLYFNSNDGTIYAVNSTSGKKIWQTDDDGAPKFPMVDNDKLYHGGYHHIHALDAKSGSQIWESSVASGHTATIGAPPVIANGVLYVSFDYDLFRALNAKTGEVLWQFPDP
ncbi:MAG: PQQ-binding-like beta-propeller repeat protein, partial [Nitrososphaerota archaeon]|nr:PQQ-binding-like beta-propeller repeat protein [Nitrososphaerota archaeon]